MNALIVCLLLTAEPATSVVSLKAAELTAQARKDFANAFVDADEKDGTVVISDEATFRKTGARMKWDIAQK